MTESEHSSWKKAEVLLSMILVSSIFVLTYMVIELTSCHKLSLSEGSRVPYFFDSCQVDWDKWILVHDNSPDGWLVRNRTVYAQEEFQRHCQAIESCSYRDDICKIIYSEAERKECGLATN